MVCERRGMKLTVNIDPSVAETEIVVTAKAIDTQVQAIQEIVSSFSGGDASVRLERIVGLQGSQAKVLDIRSILSFYTNDKSVYAHTLHGDWLVKARIYQLEEWLASKDFVRISQSEIVSFSAIKNLDLSISGTISLRLKDDTKCFVSRRQLPHFKKCLGL